MSGGFFRGTSADQDTRFSNKQAKLLKSQKFPPELDQLVDMMKVKMDVIRPWIAHRVTELLGFEDEVLINFIYGLLDGKVVDGKQIQIQLTGFMEKNTGKFMKELWSLLLSAQKNASGVPQQFLDAKEEETRKKKAEADRITQELQKRKEKEGREFEQERQKRMDNEVDDSRATNVASDAISKLSPPKDSNTFSGEGKEADERHDSRAKNRLCKSPHSVDNSPSSRRSTPSPARSSGKSFSNSRSYSDDRHKSRSISGSPQPRRHSISPDRRYHSPPRHSISPRRKYSPRKRRSPPRRSPHSRRRSLSRSRRRSLSPIRRRSPLVRRRSPSPVRRRSPSPVRRRSPSPVRRRFHSPLRRRSPSPPRRRSPSPMRRRSPWSRSPKHWRRSPVRSPRRRAMDSQISPRQRNRSRSPYESRSRSPPYRSRRSLSRDRDSHINGVESRRYRDDNASQKTRGKRSPVRRTVERVEIERIGPGRKGPVSVSHQLRSPQCDPKDRSVAHHKEPVFSPSPVKSLSPSQSPRHMRGTIQSEDKSPLENPARQTRERAVRHDSPETSRDEGEISHAREDAGQRFDSLRKIHSPTVGNRKKLRAKELHPEEYSSDRLVVNQSAEARGHPYKMELKKKDHDRRSDNTSLKVEFPERRTQQVSRVSEEIEYGPGRLEAAENDEHASPKKFARNSSLLDERLSNEHAFLKKSNSRDGHRQDEKKRSLPSSIEFSDLGHKADAVHKSTKKTDQRNRVGSFNSDSEENETHVYQNITKRKSKRPESQEVALDDDAGFDSQIDERKEAKRRRKDEKRLRKEERRRKREERHRRREERRAGKLKTKSMDTVTPPSDYEKNQNDADNSDGDIALRRDAHPSDTEETESEQKKLEIELRKKALESLRAKKAISH
eukprot:TRINITY_DN6397_c0_g1_i1.p1 TRINITY_DN6397_c0_g1~~TRINITY_DN6397_c0_g1_i1.p1  ORF type:complete len:894 (-),score=198.38 TRINITY_DN6397_c0_g1_i1:396-3077(-)